MAEDRASHDAETARLLREAHVELVGLLTTLLRDPDAARDVAQEAGLRLLLQPKGSLRNPRAFLFFVATNLARDELRRRARAPHTGADETLDAVPVASAERAHEARAALDEVGRGFALLPPKQRRVLWLSRVEGCTNAEVAERAGISVKTVEKHLSRGLPKLAAILRALRAEVGS